MRNRNKRGYLKIVRKCPEFWLQNTGVAGTPRLGWISGGAEVNYTGTVVTLGTATAGMNGAFDIPFSAKFSLSDVINYSDIATLADKYRIKGVYLRLIPNFTTNGVQSLYNYPSVQYCIDDDDSTAPTVSSLREKMGVKTKTFKPGEYIGIKIRWPKVAMAVTDAPAGTIGAADVKGGQWLNSSYVNVQHFGLKGVISNMDLPVTGTAKIAVKFDVAYVIEAKDFQ